MVKGLNHVGISVSDLDRSVEFYRRVLGMELVIETGFEGQSYAQILALTGPNGRVAALKASTFELELFEFASPQPRAMPVDRPVCDHGISHFCVEVSDIESEYERLLSLGVVFHCPPASFPGGDKATYARDPDGNVFELLELARVQA